MSVDLTQPQLFMRSTRKDGKAYGGFQWPMEVGAVVEAKDWDGRAKCGGGLHGLLDGAGAYRIDHSPDALWWIVEASDAVDLVGKYKFQKCTVIAFGPKAEIAAQMRSLRPYAPVQGSTVTAGDGSTVTAWYGSTVTAGDCSTVTAGDRSTVTAGDNSTLIFTRRINCRKRILVGYVGENGIRPNVACRANDDFTAIVEVAK